MRLPFFIEVKGRRVLVVGGGEEGTKKAKRFLNAGASVAVLSLEFSEELRRLAKEGKVTLVQGDAGNQKLLERLVAGNDFVVSSLNDAKELDDLILEAAQRHRRFTCLAGDADRTPVVMAIEGRVGELRMAMTSEGLSSLTVMEALRRILDFLKQQKDLFHLLHLMAQLKSYMKGLKIPADVRIPLYRLVFRDPAFRRMVSEGRVEEARPYAEALVRREWHAR